MPSDTASQISACAQKIYSDAIATCFKLEEVDQAVIDGLIQSIADVLTASGAFANASSAPTITPAVQATSSSRTEKSKKSKKPRAKRLPALNAYNVFIKQKSQTLANVPSKDRMKVLAEQWKAMSEDEKAPFKQLADLFNEAVKKQVSSPEEQYDRKTVVNQALVEAGLSV